MSRSGELTKKTLIITVGRISTQFITFLLLPLYTALLSTEEYGTVDLVITLVQLFIPVISLMIDQGAFRYLLNVKDDEQRKSTISSSFLALSILSIVALIVYSIVAPFISTPYKIWFILISLVMAFSNLFLQIARGLNFTSEYALGSFVCSASTIILNVVCIAILRMNAIGMLFATFAGNLICCIFMFFRLHICEYIAIKSINKTNVVNQLNKKKYFNRA